MSKAALKQQPIEQTKRKLKTVLDNNANMLLLYFPHF